jgi:stearoyl-CoA desaturase (delta-9 desaturase)
MFTMPNWVEKFFFVFSFVAQGSSYMSPKVYGILHRLHHEHADKEEDPHSPLFSTNFVTLMVKTYHKFAGIQSGAIKVKEAITKNLPDWKWFDKMAGFAISKNTLVIILYLVLLHFCYRLGGCTYSFQCT